MANDDMNHLTYLGEIARADVSVLEGKEKTYQGSWKKAGGRSAWFMFRRNMDRLLGMCKKVDFRLEPSRLFRALEKGGEGLTLTYKEVEALKKALASEDIFALISAEPSGADGTVLACLRDLRRYALLLESEMVAQGAVAIEWGPEGKPPIDTSALTAIGANIGELNFSELESRAFAQIPADPSVSQKDENRYRDLVAAAGLYSLSSEEVERIASELLTSEKTTGDLYGDIAAAVGISRDEVKRRCFVVMYGTGRRPKLPEFQVLPTPEQTSSKVERGWGEKAVSQTLRYLGGADSGQFSKIVAAVLACRQGGGVVGRISEVLQHSGEEETYNLLTRRLYAEPDEDFSEMPPVDFHKDLARAIAHSLNYHGVDAALGCADHILAELLVPEVIRHLKGLTDAQLVEQGWTFGPHGVPVRPPAEALPAGLRPPPNTWCTRLDWLIEELGRRTSHQHGSAARVVPASGGDATTLFYEPGEKGGRCWLSLDGPRTSGPLTVEHLVSIVGSWWVGEDTARAWPGAPDPKDPNAPGTPADGGHHPQSGDTRTVTAGNRFNHLAKIGESMIREGHPLQETIATVRTTNQTQCHPPLRDADVDTVCRLLGRAYAEANKSGEAERLVPRPQSAPEQGPLTLADSAARTSLLAHAETYLPDPMSRLVILVADHGARMASGPNLSLEIVRLSGMGTAFGIRKEDSGNWFLLSHESIQELASLWFPSKSSVIQLGSNALSLAATDNIRQRAGSPLDGQS